jgi:hypothetical protein
MSKTTNLIEAEWLAGRIIWAELSNGEAKQALKGIIQAYVNSEITARKEAYLRNIRIASVEEIGIGDSIFCYQIPDPHYGIVTRHKGNILTVAVDTKEKIRVVFSSDAVFWDTPQFNMSAKERQALRKKYFEERFTA